jgi:hypothetical protein
MEFYEDPAELWVAGLMFVAVYVAVYLALNFFAIGIKKHSVLFGKVNYALGFTFLFIALNFSGKIIHDYFSATFFFPDIAVLGVATAFICIAIVEPTFRKNYFFTLMAAVDLGLFLIFNSASPFYIINLLWIGWDFIFLLRFSLFLRKNTTGGTRRRLWMMLISTDFIIVGIILTLYRVQAIDVTFSLVITGYSCLIIGLVGIFATFYHSNLFIESGWRNSLEELYIIHDKLLQPLYYQNLNLDAPASEEKVSFFSRSLVGIDIIMKTITEMQSGGKSRVSLITQEGKFLLIEHSFNAIVCFVTNQNMKSLRYYLREIRNAWDTYYSSRPIDWGSAQQEIFSVMQVLVNRILQGGAK